MARYKGIFDTHFDSMAEFVSYVRDTPPTWNRQYLDENDRPKDWNGNVTFLQALNLAEFGWPEGRRMLSDVICEVDPNTLNVQATETLSLDVAGAYPLVPLAVTGDPASMIEVETTEASTKIVRIVATVSFRGTMSPKAVMSHGAAVLSYIDALENAGWRCEVIGRSLALNCYQNAQAMSVTLKRPQDHLDVDTMAFALIHPAFLRRLIFRYRETIPTHHEGHEYPQGDHGGTISDNPGDCEAFIPMLKDNELADTDKALAYVGDKLDSTLKPAA